MGSFQSAFPIVAPNRFQEIAGDPINVRAVCSHDSFAESLFNFLRSMSEKIQECQRHLSTIQQRDRALAFGWDETCRTTGAEFDRCVREFSEINQNVQRLHEGGISLSLSSSSDDRSTKSALVEPPSAASSATASSAQEEYQYG